MVYHERALLNYLIPCHRQYIRQYNQCEIRAVHDGKVGGIEYRRVNNDSVSCVPIGAFSVA